nr:phytosulfokine receptor 1-like [Ziziphus jujuba var. spinosa]
MGQNLELFRTHKGIRDFLQILALLHQFSVQLASPAKLIVFQMVEFPKMDFFKFIQQQLALLGFVMESLEWTNSLPGWEFFIFFFIDFSNNSLTGEIPKSITDLRSLIDSGISIEETSLDFPILMKRNLDASGLPYNKLLSFPPTLDFSYNNLSGPIWPEFGNLRTLHVLNLKVNKISGPIPSNLSGMTSLETLDLSHNKLSGTIPASLVKLSFLSKFNVADNQLYGQIPSGGQFSTFPASSFQGNNLCGDHNSPCESNDQLPSLQPDESSRSNSIINSGFFIAMAIGFAFGLFSSIISCNKKILKSLLKLFCKNHLY